MMYEELVPLTRMPVLRCYGLLEEPEAEFCWFFLEDAAGARYSQQLSQDRALAGYWLAETQLATVSTDLKSCLPNRELDHYLHLLRGCRAMLLHHLSGGGGSAWGDLVLRQLATHIHVLGSRWSQVGEILRLVPPRPVPREFALQDLLDRHTGPRPLLAG